MINEADLGHLRRCVELAEAALKQGNSPFGSVLVLDGVVRWSGHNVEVTESDPTGHPELAAARWAAAELTPQERVRAVVYTSGEHCPMCAAAHAWAGLGRIVYAVSGLDLAQWLADWGQPRSPVAPLPITVVVPGVAADGPAPELRDELKALHRRWADRATTSQRSGPPRLQLTSITIGSPDPRRSAAFYARLFATDVVQADPPRPGEPDEAGWAQLRTTSDLGRITLNLEYERHFVRPVWPSEPGQQQITEHLDIWVDDLEAAEQWAIACGARPAEFQPQDDVRVMLDPDGHPFCLFT